MENSLLLATKGEHPYFKIGWSLYQNLTQKTEITNFGYDNEGISANVANENLPIEIFSALLCIIQDIYDKKSAENIEKLGAMAEEMLRANEIRRRQFDNGERAACICDIKITIGVDLRSLYMKQHGGKRPSPKDIRGYYAMFKNIAATKLKFIVPVKTQRGDIYVNVEEPLISFPPLLSIEEQGEAAAKAKKGDTPYLVTMSVSTMTIYRVGEMFVKFPSDLPTRLTQANTDNPIFKALIYEMLRLRSHKDSDIRGYIKAKNNKVKPLPQNPCYCDFTITQILERLNGNNIRPNRLEKYVINAFEAFKKTIGIIHDYKIEKDKEGKISRVRFTLNSQFLKTPNKANTAQ